VGIPLLVFIIQRRLAHFPFRLFPLLLFHYFSYQPEINEGQTNNSGNHIRRTDNYEYAGIWILGLELLIPLLNQSAIFVGTACPGDGRGRRLPQCIFNTPRHILATSIDMYKVSFP
jgi:hypothetical protein